MVEGGGPTKHDDVVPIIAEEVIVTVMEDVLNVCSLSLHSPLDVADGVRVEV